MLFEKLPVDLAVYVEYGVSGLWFEFEPCACVVQALTELLQRCGLFW